MGNMKKRTIITIAITMIAISAMIAVIVTKAIATENRKLRDEANKALYSIGEKSREEEQKKEEIKKQEENEKKIKALNTALDLAKAINQRTKEFFLITAKVESKELNSTDDIKSEISKIDTKVRSMISTYEKTDKTNIQAVDDMTTLLNEMTISLDESFIKMMAGISSDNVDKFKAEIKNVVDIKNNTEKIITKLSELKNKTEI